MVKVVEYHSPINSTIHILLWGKEGVGKTYLSASMPKKILYLTFDPNALNGVNDLLINGKIQSDQIPMLSYDEGDYKEIAKAYKDINNPFGLEDVYKDLKFNTLVIDSLSSYFKLALQYGVDYTNMTDREKCSIEKPSYGGYGVRSVATKNMVFNVINWCNKHNINSMFIAHKGDMVKDNDTGMLYHGLGLSGDISTEIAKWFDECWLMGVTDEGERMLTVHPKKNIRPLKTRIFSDDVQTVSANSLDVSKLLDAWKQLGKINLQALKNL